MTDKTPALEALKLCRDQFSFYADEHRKAGKNDKAITNERYRDICNAALQPVSAEAVAWRCPQPSETHPWAFTWDIDTVRMWEELLPENGPVQPLYTSTPDQSARIRELEDQLEAANLNHANDVAQASFDKAKTCASRIEELEAEVKAERRRATNAEYMRDFCRQLLGPVASEQVETMIRNGVERVHVSWGPDAIKMTGEERAAQYKAFSEAPRTEVSFDDNFEGPNKESDPS